MHRINVPEPDGTLRMVISNHARLLQVTPDGTPSISFLDADGKVLSQLGPTSRNDKDFAKRDAWHLHLKTDGRLSLLRRFRVSEKPSTQPQLPVGS